VSNDHEENIDENDEDQPKFILNKVSNFVSKGSGTELFACYLLTVFGSWYKHTI
jgi:hypothetical protein